MQNISVVSSFAERKDKEMCTMMLMQTKMFIFPIKYSFKLEKSLDLFTFGFESLCLGTSNLHFSLG